MSVLQILVPVLALVIAVLIALDAGERGMEEDDWLGVTFLLTFAAVPFYMLVRSPKKN